MDNTWNVLVAQKDSHLVQRFRKIFEDSPSRYDGKLVKVFVQQPVVLHKRYYLKMTFICHLSEFHLNKLIAAFQ